MLASRWEPWAEMNRLGREMDRLLGRSGSDRDRSFGMGGYPAINLWEDADNLYAEAELPGFRMDQLEIFLTGNQLTIKGDRCPPPANEGTWHRQERGFGKFNRIIELPGDIAGDKVSAKLSDGVLTITLPKCEALKPRRIRVNAG